jgi:hypothetical protein
VPTRPRYGSGDKSPLEMIEVELAPPGPDEGVTDQMLLTSDLV